MKVPRAAETADLRSRLAALFGVEPREARPVARMVTLYFLVAASFVVVETTGFGLFIEEFGSRALPLAYLSVAILSSLAAYLYLKFSERVSFASAELANLGFLALACFLFWIGLRSPVSHWLIFLLPFWLRTLVSLANLVVWHLAGHLFDLRQAKRLFGLIGAGHWFANILGGVVVVAILEALDPASLYLLAAAALALAALVLRPILKDVRPTPSPTPRRLSAHGSRSPAARASPLRHPYVRMIFAYTLLWWIGFSLVDNIFFDRAENQLPSSEHLAAFIAGQLAVMGVVALFTTAFLAGRIASHYGLRAGLLVMPLAVTVPIALLAAGGTLGWSAAALFWIAAAAKTLNVALGLSISLAMGSLLFQPLLGHQRHTASTIAEGIVQPLAIGVAGLLLLLFNTTLRFNAIGLAYVFLALSIPWFWTIFRLSDQYPIVVSEALQKRGLGETTTLLFPPSALAQLREGLHDQRPGLALYALNQLERQAPRSWPQTLADELPHLLQHPSPEVRAEAVTRVLALGPPAVLPDLRRALAVESDPRVRSVLLQTLATMHDRESETAILAALESGDGGVHTERRGAILGLLADGTSAHFDRARRALENLARSPEFDDRVVACGILGQSAPPGVASMISRLMLDPILMVRHAAIRAAAQHSEPALVDALLSACDSASTARAAEAALIAQGENALQAIARELDSGNVDSANRERLHSLIRVLGRIRAPRAQELLAEMMGVRDPDARLYVLQSLSSLGYRDRSRVRILSLIRSELEQAAWLAAAIGSVEGLGDRAGVAVLESSLESAFRDTRSRALLLLSFAFPPQAILRAHAALQQESTERLAFALETVDALLPPHIKPLLMPLIDALPHHRRVAHWRAAGVPVDVPSLHGLFDALLSPDGGRLLGPWTRMCAAYAVAVLGERSAVPALERMAAEAHPRLGEMARWSLNRLVAAGPGEGDPKMLSLVERVLILKSAPLFGETPDNVLADLGDVVEEVSFDKDEVIFEKGDRGDSLYVIIGGSVKVWDGDRLLNELSDGEVFGELALLDPAPRLATIRAAEPTSLLRLDEANFREVLDSRPEVSAAIIRVITRYLKSQLQYARQASAKLRALESFGFLAAPDVD